MADNYALTDSVISPASRVSAITPHDTLALSVIPKAIYVGTAGDITLRGSNDTADVLFKNVPAGSILAVRPAYIRATGTTAADLVALA